MNRVNRYTWLMNWLYSPVGATCAVICCLTGMMLGIQAARTYCYPPPPSFYADFSGAQWIHAQGGVDTGYFRKRVYIASQIVSNAWIEVAGPDYYEVYVNGNNLLLPATAQNIYPNMTAGYVSAEPQCQFDITPYLRHGENAICVYVRRRMNNHGAGLLLKGFVKEDTNSQWIYSDTSWKAKPIPNEMVGQFAWTGPDMDDDPWPYAELLPPGKIEECYQPLSIPPSIFTLPISGNWIAPADPFQKQSYYKKEFTIPAGTQDSWLELASVAQNVEVYLNGHFVTNNNLLAITQNPTAAIPILPIASTATTTTTVANSSLVPATQTIVTPQSTAPVPTPMATTSTPVPPVASFVNLHPWLHSGLNKLEIHAENSLSENAIEGEIMFRSADDKVTILPSDQTWSGHGLQGAAAKWSSAIALAPYSYPPYGYVTKVCTPSLLPSDEIGREVLYAWVWGIGIFLLWVGAWLTFSRILAERRASSWAEAHIVDALAQVPFLVILLILWLTQLDIRVSPEAPYQPYIFDILIGFTIFTRLLLYFPISARSGAQVQQLSHTEPPTFRPHPTQLPQSQHRGTAALRIDEVDDPSPVSPVARAGDFTAPAEGGVAMATSGSTASSLAYNNRTWITPAQFTIILGCIVAFSFGLRASGLMQFPLDYDECFMRNCVHGIVERGFPSTAHGDLLYRLSTYELIPWPEAICGILTGWQDWSLRVPGLIYGTLTTLCLGLFGAKIFDYRVGILAAACYACTSFSVYWTRDCFHMPQCQFSALLCFYFFYKSIEKGNGVDFRYFRWAAITLCTTYLSWEGAGFLLPAFTVTLLAMHPTDWRWARQFYFWAGLTFVCSVVLCQLCSHAMTQPAYLGLGIGLSDLTAPSLAFLDPNIDITYYYYHFILTPSHFLLGLFSLIGLFCYWNCKPIRYFLVMYFTLFLAFSGLLTVQDTRYAYFYQTMLFLGGSAVLIRFYDSISLLGNSLREVWPAWPSYFAKSALVLVACITFLAASELGIKLFRISELTINPDSFFRYHDLYIDAETASLYVKNHMKPGDAIISVSPHCFQHFTGLNSYGDNPLLLKRMYYMHDKNGKGVSSFIDRYAGTTDIHNNLELQNVYHNYKRVWFVAAPYLIFIQTSDPYTSGTVLDSSELRFENSACRVYLSDGYGGSSEAASVAQTTIPSPPSTPHVQSPSRAPVTSSVQPSISGIAALLNPDLPNPLNITGSILEDGPIGQIPLSLFYLDAIDATSSSTIPVYSTSSTSYSVSSSSTSGSVTVSSASSSSSTAAAGSSSASSVTASSSGSSISTISNYSPTTGQTITVRPSTSTISSSSLAPSNSSFPTSLTAPQKTIAPN